MFTQLKVSNAQIENSNTTRKKATATDTQHFRGIRADHVKCEDEADKVEKYLIGHGVEIVFR